MKSEFKKGLAVASEAILADFNEKVDELKKVCDQLIRHEEAEPKVAGGILDRLLGRGVSEAEHGEWSGLGNGLQEVVKDSFNAVDDFISGCSDETLAGGVLANDEDEFKLRVAEGFIGEPEYYWDDFKEYAEMFVDQHQDDLNKMKGTVDAVREGIKDDGEVGRGLSSLEGLVSRRAADYQLEGPMSTNVEKLAMQLAEYSAPGVAEAHKEAVQERATEKAELLELGKQLKAQKVVATTGKSKSREVDLDQGR